MREFRVALRNWAGFAAMLAIVGLVGCGSGEAFDASSRVFEVTHVSPPDETVLGVQPSVIRFVFSREVDTASVNDRSIRLVSEDEVEIDGERSVHPRTPTTVEFKPRDDLLRGVRYFAIASTEVRDAGGQPLESAHISQLALLSPTRKLPESGPRGQGPVVCPNPVGRTVYYVNGTSSGIQILAVDSETGQKLPDGHGGGPSYRLHDCQRWFLAGLRTGVTMPTGLEQRGVRVVSEAGETVVLFSPEKNQTVVPSAFPVRWAKDDSFFSFLMAEWGSTNATAYIVRIPVVWLDGRPVAQLTKEERFVPSTAYKDGTAEVHLFDWSPSGNQVVYSIDASMPNAFRRHLYIYDVLSDTKKFLTVGDEPQWRAFGPDDKAPIAYEDHMEKSPGVYTIYPDGTGEALVTPKWSPSGGNHRRESPQWSPDGTRLAISRTEQDMKAGQQRTWSVEILDLETLTLEEISTKPHNFLLGWR
ncbi:MAG: Ig-like domain-containing protein [Planctomycetota bacterium]|jgi:hypothetical protein